MSKVLELLLNLLPHAVGTVGVVVVCRVVLTKVGRAIEKLLETKKTLEEVRDETAKLHKRIVEEKEVNIKLADEIHRYRMEQRGLHNEKVSKN